MMVAPKGWVGDDWGGRRVDNLRTLLRTYRSERRQIMGITALLVVGAVFETVALVLLVPIATAVGTGNDTINRISRG